MLNSRITRTILFAVLAASLLVMLPTPASAQRFGFGFGPYWGPVYPYGYWGAYPYGPYPYGPYGYYGRPLGEVKIKTPMHDADIYVNGSVAGRARDLKRFYLAPGTYNIEQRVGSDIQKQRIYVIASRSVQLEFGKPGTPSPQPVPPPPPARRLAPGSVAPPPPAPDADPAPQTVAPPASPSQQQMPPLPPPPPADQS